MDVHSKRRGNERKFTRWPEGGRRYVFEVQGKRGWSARYIKEVDSNEETTRFYQEIYNARGVLVEIHEKYPENKGHRVIAEAE
jgi:hypothetical protein